MTKTSSKVKNKWNRSHYDTITIQVPKGQKEEIREEAKAAGVSLQEYIRQAIEEKRGI